MVLDILNFRHFSNTHSNTEIKTEDDLREHMTMHLCIALIWLIWQLWLISSKLQTFTFLPHDRSCGSNLDEISESTIFDGPKTFSLTFTSSSSDGGKTSTGFSYHIRGLVLWHLRLWHNCFHEKLCDILMSLSVITSDVL